MNAFGVSYENNCSYSSSSTTTDEDCWIVVNGNQSSGNGSCEHDFLEAGQEYVYYYCIAMPICIATVLGNGLTLDAHRKLERARRSEYYPIILLAACDLCTGVSQPVMMALYYLRKAIGDMEYIQLMNYSVFLVSVISSMLALLALSADRCMGVMFPLHYRASMTRMKRGLIAGLVFGPALLGGLLLPLLWHNRYDPSVCYVDWDFLQIMPLDYFRYLILPAFLFLTILLLAVYAVIIHKARRHLLARSLTFSAGDAHRASAAAKVRRSERKLLHTTLVIFVTFYLCWLPFMVVIAVQVYGPEHLRLNKLLIAVRSFCTIPATLNSTINPIVYAFRVPVFRAHVTRRFGCNKGLQRERTADAMTTSTTSDTRLSTISRAV